MFPFLQVVLLQVQAHSPTSLFPPSPQPPAPDSEMLGWSFRASGEGALQQAPLLSVSGPGLVLMIAICPCRHLMVLPCPPWPVVTDTQHLTLCLLL